METAASLLSRLRRGLAEDGLHVVLPVGGSAFDRVAGETGCPSLGELLPGASGAVLVGDGGPSFFARFEALRARSAVATAGAGASAANPLDDYTRQVVERAVRAAWTPDGVASTACFRLLYPFVDAAPALPFQRLGEVAGLPPPGPLGIQIHPSFGPWWAYRALVVVAASLETEPPLSPSCSVCAQPCVEACPGRAVTTAGFSFASCITERTSPAGIACHESCVARLRCPVGSAHRYGQAQLAFHMRASLPLGQPRRRT